MDNKVQLGFRAQPELADRVDSYARNRDVSQSEALRLIVERGLEMTEMEVADIETMIRRAVRQELEKRQDG